MPWLEHKRFFTKFSYVQIDRGGLGPRDFRSRRSEASETSP